MVEKIRNEKDREKAFGSLTRINRLAQYNAEKNRGLVHTEEWKEFMEKEQEWLNLKQEHFKCGLEMG